MSWSSPPPATAEHGSGGIRARLETAERDALRARLSAGRSLGFLGPGPIESHIERSLDLAGGVDREPGVALDLGSGGGLPGLPLSMAWRDSRWILLDSNRRRASFLAECVEALGLADRVSVLVERAEEAGRGPLRYCLDLVVARSFGRPAVTAECASPFLRPGGRLVVAEPPGGEPARWEQDGLEKLGMGRAFGSGGSTAFQVIVQEQPCPDRYPRRTGIPSKRPLF